MSRTFSLAGLLRVRGVQERAAAQALSMAALEARRTEAREQKLRTALDATGAEAGDVRTLAALAASRVASRSMLADLRTMGELQAQQVDRARAAHTEARRAERGLDRLARKHAEAAREDELRAEQAEFDEIASRTGGDA